MSSKQEYENAKQQLENFPDEITGDKRRQLRRKLQKTIKEYEYSKYKLFSKYIEHFYDIKKNSTTVR